MSGRFVRASQFRHVYGEPNKKQESYLDIKPQCLGESSYIVANKTWFAFAKQGGGGPVSVAAVGKLGRTDTKYSINVHTAKVADLSFNPFDDSLLATGSDDCHIKLSQIPDGGLTENITKPLVVLEGHQKKITLIEFSPTASNVLASCSHDTTVKIWDVAEQEEIFSYDGHSAMLQSLHWSQDGSTLVTKSQDKMLRMYDPRVATEVVCVDSQLGSKPAKALSIDNHGLIWTCGRNKYNMRVWALWDKKKMEAPVATGEYDSGSGAFMAYYDPDTSIVYLGGKGDGQIRYYEISNGNAFHLSTYQGESQKGFTILPKAAVDVTKCEIARCIRLMQNWARPVSFIVPRKSDLFQSDIFPDCYAELPAMTTAEWKAGENKPAPTMPLDPKKRQDVQKQGGFVAAKSKAELKEELKIANARIAELEAELAKLKA